MRNERSELNKTVEVPVTSREFRDRLTSISDIRNMLWSGALSSVVVPISHHLMTGATLNLDMAMVQMTLGFSLGMVAGLPLGRLLKL